MRHGNTRHIAAKHLADFISTVTGSVNNIFTANFANVSFNNPFVIYTLNACDRAETHDLGAHITCTFSKSLCQLGRVNIAIKGIPLTAVEVMCFKEWIDFLHLRRRHFLEFNTHLATHGFNMAELFHTLAGMSQADRASDVIVHRVVYFFTQSAVKLG